MSSNPFADPISSNPFEDSGVVNVASNAQYTEYNHDPMDFYANPYEQGQAPIDTPDYSLASKEEAAVAITESQSKTTMKKPNLLGKKSGSNAFPGAEEEPRDGAAEDRAAELDKRERALAEREAELQRMEQKLLTQGGSVRSKNWPSRCCGIARHYLTDDIPVRYRILVWKFYALMHGTWLTLVLNAFLMIYLTFGSGDSTTGVMDVIFSMAFVFIGIPLSWMGWYKSLYKATQTQKNRTWIWFFILFTAHLGFCVFAAIAIKGSGQGGVIKFIQITKTKDKIAIILGLVVTFLFILASACSVYLLKQAHLMWTTDGHAVTLKRDLAQGMIESGLAEEAIKTTGRL